MLTVMPEKNQEFINKVFSQLENCPEGTQILSACAGDERLGYIVISAQQRKVVIFDINVTSCVDLSKADAHVISLCDSMIRSAMSYGLNRNCFILHSKVTEPASNFRSLGFTQVGDDLVADSMEILSQPCSGC